MRQNVFRFFSLLFFLALYTGFISAQVTTNSGSGLAPTYTSLADAITALNAATITSPVVITLTGNETAPAGGYAITQLGGTSTNTISIQGSSSTITANAGLTAGALNDAIFKLIGADYVTISNFTMLENAANTTTAAGTNNMTEWGVALLYATVTDGAQNNTITGCTIDLDRTYQNTFGIYSNSTHSPTAVTTSATATGAAGGNSGLVITGNNITDVNNGIVVVGPTAAADHNQGLTIGGSAPNANIITNFGTTGTFSSYANVSGTVNGILVRNTVNYTVAYNTVTSSVGGVTVGTLNGIQQPAFSSTPTGTFTNNINNNTISLQSGLIAGAMNGINCPSGSASATSVFNCNNNNFVNWGHTVAGTGSIVFILNASVHLTQSISNNTFTNLTVNTTGSVTFISNTNTPPVGSLKNVNNNSIVTAFSKTGAGGTVTLFVDNGSDVNLTSVNNSNNNNFSNITVTGATTIAGWGNTNGGAPTKNVNGNTFSNWVGGTSAITGLSINFDAGLTTAQNNLVSNISSAGAITGILFGGSGTAGTTNASLNTVHTLTSTGTGAVTGFSIGGASTVARNIFRNSVYNLENTNAGGSVNGMLISSGTIYVSNNFISDLRAPAATLAAEPIAQVRGINITSTTATSTVGVYYNSIYLNASSSGANFGSAGVFHTTSATATTAALDLRNNVIVNNSVPSGIAVTAAYRRSSTTLTNFGSASNNNDFYAGTPSAARLIFFDGTNLVQTIGDYKTLVAPRCVAAFSENPPFLNVSTTPYNLHMNTGIATQTESGGTPVSTPVAITDDFDGNLRNASTPDVGADEFAGVGLDLSAPIISYTALGPTGSFSNRTLVVTVTDVSGVPTTAPGWPYLYWRINAGSWTAATPTGVAGSDYTFSFGAGVVVGDVVEYYVVAQDLAGTPNVGAFPSAGAGGFTINPPAAATPPTTPSSYLVVGAPLSGSYTVGNLLFNSITGRNITFEKSVQLVMKEVWVETPTDKKQAGTNESLDKPAGRYELREVEEISYIPMENGVRYTGDLFIKKSLNPEFNYPAGTEGVYATITAAVSDLNLRGVGGATTFLLTDATYTTETLPIVVNILSASLPSAVNTVTIRPNTGVTASITGASATAQVFRIRNSYVTIDGSNSGGTDRSLTIENTSLTTPQVVSINPSGASPLTNITLKNCILINGVNTSSAVVVTDLAGTAGYFNNITIQNNSVQKAYIGIFTNAFVLAGNGSGLLITGNDLSTSGANAVRYVGVYVQGADGATVSKNIIANFDGASGEDDRGIWFATGTMNSTIDANAIHTLNYTGTGGYGCYGAAISTGVTNANIVVKNNMIYNLSGDGWTYLTVLGDNTHGLYIFSTQTGIKVYHNSIHLYGNTLNQTNAFSVGITLGTGSTADLKNNIIVNNLGLLGATGYGSAGIYLQAANTQLEASNYNDIFVNPTGTGVKFIGQIAAVGSADLTTWQTASLQDANSLSADPKFVGNTDLHIDPSFNIVSNNGTFLASVPVDFDGQTRNNPPDIGADEYTYTPPSVIDPSGVTATPISGSQIDVAFTPNGASNNVVVVWNTTGTFTDPLGAPVVNNPLAGGTVLSIGITSPVSHTLLSPSTTYYYKLFSYNGTAYSPGVTANATTPCAVVVAPWNQDFELATFPPNCWAISTSGTGNWARSTLASGFGVGTASARANFYSIDAGDIFDLITLEFNASGMTAPRLKFDFAYAAYTGGEVDSMVIYYSTNGGSSFSSLLVMPGGAAGSLNPFGIVTSSSFTPTAGQWTTQTILLPAGTNMVRFTAISDFGNNLYVDNIAVEEAPSHDIGAVSLALGSGLIEKTFTSEGQGKDLLTRSMINEEDGVGIKSNQNLSVTMMVPENTHATDDAPVNFSVIVQNFGGVTENSYQVGWAINGVPQTSVNNTAPLEVGDTDTLTLVWNSPVAGVNSARAWSILATDTNPANDTSNTLGFYVIPENVVFGEYFEDVVLPPAGWLTVSNDGGGTVGPWAASPTVFTPLEGNQYIASNYSGANGLFIDDWLITPNTGGVVEADDTLSFWIQSPVSDFADSLEIRVSTTGTNIGDFTTLLAYINVPKGQWTNFKYALPTAANRYIAFRYLIYDGGVSGSNSDYVGLDAVEIISGGSTTFQLSVNIIDGWNMASVPGIHPTNQNVNTWWPNRNPLADVYRWTTAYVPVSVTAPTQGYWMLHNGAQTYNTGDEWPAGGIQYVTHDPIPVNAGWNMIGGYENSASVAGLTTTPPGLITPGTVYGWNGTYFNATNLVPGFGYWVLLTGSGVINPPTLIDGTTIAKQDDRSDWGKITITDATGKSYTLYSVNGEVNLDHYQMPPLPPTGSFDVRYSSQRIAEDLSSSEQGIEMRGMVYPVTVRVDNASIKLQDETGKIVNARMESGEEITINNEYVSKLLVAENTIPTVYALEQNYPNPFNPSTVIEFSIPDDAVDVKLTIYDALGQRVTELVNTKLEAGNYQYKWDASNVASGLYVYELRTGKFNSVKKMLLLK